MKGTITVKRVLYKGKRGQTMEGKEERRCDVWRQKRQCMSDLSPERSICTIEALI